MSLPDPCYHCRSIRRGAGDSARTSSPGTFGGICPKVPERPSWSVQARLLPCMFLFFLLWVLAVNDVTWGDAAGTAACMQRMIQACFSLFH